MNLRNVGDYNIGLDIGTGSVGWAVTDKNGELCHFNGKPTWGSRIFPEADKASEARSHRGQRRRYARRRWRLDLLQGIFEEEIAKVDSEFFIRLRQSRLLKEDRDSAHSDYLWPLFNDKDFNEKDYYDKFSTIYHLRKWLMETDEKADIRLIYLAFHNIVKHRGNFLQQDKRDLNSKNADIKGSVEEFCSILQEYCDGLDIPCTVEDNADEVVAVLHDKNSSRSDIQKRLQGLLGIQACDALDKKAVAGMAKALAGALVGLSSDMTQIFFISEEPPEGLKTKIYLSKDDEVLAFEENCPDYGSTLFEAMKKVYSAYVLQEILSSCPGESISCNKVQDFKQYGEDLRLLKSLVREYIPSKYDEFFRGPLYEKLYPGEKAKYDLSKAKGYTKYNAAHKETPYDDFQKDIEKLFIGTAALDDPRYIKMMDAFRQQRFLRRLKTSDNGAIPFQLHLEELDDIIDNQKRFYPFLEIEKEKLDSLVTFRIPYYVGPLTQKNARKDASGNNRFAWSERLPGNEDKRIYPWNWNQIIDKNTSAEKFIKRMTGTCTYLQGEPVIPKCSLLYEEFCVLNELNGAHYSEDGDKEYRFDYRDRADIFEELFKNGRVTYEKLADWMNQRPGHMNVRVGGGQGEKGFESKLSSYIFFKKDVFDVDEIPKSDYPMIEEIILWNTIFEDRDILGQKLKEKYGDRLNDDQIKKIRQKRFTGWGKLSEKFLTGIKAQTDDGPRSIMDILREGNPNNGYGNKAMVLMEALRDEDLQFQKLIDAENEKKFGDITTIALNELPGSPALRRGINQTLEIVKEIVRIAGHAPANIFVEVTRSDDKEKGQRTKRRYDDLKDHLAVFKKENPKFFKEALEKELASISHGDLNEKLTLYFMQGGKSLYSGKPLDIDRLSEYEVDHILPQSYIKDDSFENKALVLKEENQRKSDQMLLPSDMRDEMKSYWDALFDARLIGKKKHKNLLRSEITEKQLKGFINRQIVETSQIVKTVQIMLEGMLPDANVQPVKAGLSHELRYPHDKDDKNQRTTLFPKCREINDFHHAHDALLACEIGRFIEVRYPDMYDHPLRYQHAVRKFVKNESERVKAGRAPFNSSFIISSFMRSGFDIETGEISDKGDMWNAAAELERIRKYLNYRQCYITRMPEETGGAFWDETIYSPHGGKKNASIPLKKGLSVKKYGGYSGKNPAYFILLLAEDSKGKYKRLFEGVYISDAIRIAKHEISVWDWAQEIASSYGLVLQKVLRAKLLKYARIDHGEDSYYVPALDCVYSSRQLYLNAEQYAQMAAVCDKKNTSDLELSDRKLEQLYDVLTDKCLVLCSRFANIHNRLVEGRDMFLMLSISDKRELLINIVDFFKGTKMRVDLTLIGGSKNAGAIKNGFITNANEEIVIVDQSITGMFERRTRIGL